MLLSWLHLRDARETSASAHGMTSKQDVKKTTEYDKFWSKDVRGRLLACLIAGLISILLWIPSFTGESLWKFIRLTQDHHARRDHQLQARTDMVLLGIDSDTMTLSSLSDKVITESPVLGTMQKGYPWDRSVYAALIERLAESGARLIVIDIVLAGEHSSEGDAALAQALEKYRDKVVLASAFMPSETGGQMILNEPAEIFLGPIENETASGYVNFWHDPHDRIVRRATFQQTFSGANNADIHPDEPRFLSLAATAAKKLGTNVPEKNKRFKMALGQKNASETYPPKSLHSIFVPAAWQDEYQDGQFFRDKIIFIGPTSPIFHDSHETIGGRIYGVQLHMHVLTSLLDESWYREGLIEDANLYNKLLLFLGLLVACLIAWKFQRTLTLALWALGCFLFWYIAEYSAVKLGDVLLASLPWLSTVLSGLLGAIIWQAMTDRTRRLQMHQHLRRSMSPDVADAIVRAPEGYYKAAAGNRRPVTVLFSDVRGFTHRSEKQNAGELVQQLNEYLERMVEVIFAHGGTVDKFIGDAVMATWGALDGMEENKQVESATQAALKMLEKLDALNKKWRSEGLEEFNIGIGIHRGDAIVGEIGSEARTDFTVIGDAVNLASRIEGLTKKLGCNLLFSDTLADSETALSLGKFRVLGREQPVEIFTLTKSSAATKKLFTEGLIAFQQGNLSQAKESFSQITDDSLTGIVKFLSDKMESEITHPTKDWDGIINFDQK